MCCNNRKRPKTFRIRYMNGKGKLAGIVKNIACLVATYSNALQRCFESDWLTDTKCSSTALRSQRCNGGVLSDKPRPHRLGRRHGRRRAERAADRCCIGRPSTESIQHARLTFSPEHTLIAGQVARHEPSVSEAGRRASANSSRKFVSYKTGYVIV